MGDQEAERPQPVGVAGRAVDPRVAAVLEVLRGDPLADVAARWSVDKALLQRWVGAFVEAGTAQVTNRPVGEMARQRDRFLTTFMHGLRGPLAVAQMWVGLLHDTPEDPSTTVRISDQLQAALDDLDEKALDVELLTASMLGRLVLEPQRLRIGELTSVLTPDSTIGGEGGDVEVNVDPALFSRILRDLWDAAHTTAAVVSVEVETIAPWVEIRIVREGDPIEPDVLHAMFEPFDRDVDNARVTVGLYLARALTVVHGGTIGVSQDSRRTTFAVRVPDARLSVTGTDQGSTT